MGEAKRRKLLDPNYGKVGKGFARSKVSLGILISKQSGNHIVYCKKCNFWIDSATKKEDADLVKKAVEELATKNPPKALSREGWFAWLQEYWSEIPNVDAKTWTVDPENASNALESILVKNMHPADINGAKETTFFARVNDDRS